VRLGAVTLTRSALLVVALIVLAGFARAVFLRASPTPAGDQPLRLHSDGATLAAIVDIPETAPHPLAAVVLIHGSGRITGAEMMANAGRRLTALGLAVLAYDKRGAGESTGEYASIGPGNSDRMFDLLAGDALAGVEALRARKDIDPRRIGLVGFSQAGCIAPLAAARSAHVAFVVTISGPAVSVGEEIAYSRLAGDDPGSIQGLTDDEITRRMQEFRGPHGYDPLPVLRTMAAPSLWILGDRDRSIPLRKTVDTLQRLASEGRPIDTRVFPGVNHGMRSIDGGAPPDVWGTVGGWLRDRGVLK
jgi:dienelactone hydrolase